ncbi:MAG: hypothetical protein K2K03_08730 [Prevotella sp.]|nr:hypothetical protein [Prevotella sp.]
MNQRQKMKISQDALYKYLTEHGVKVIRIAELMGKTPQMVISCFRHHNNWRGNPRRFSVENIRQLNDALQVIAGELRGCLITFGTDQAYTNKHGCTYDPGLIEPINRLGELLNITSLLGRLLGWSKSKKQYVFCIPSSKAYGNISESDVMTINAEVLAIAGVLEGLEVVPDANAFDDSSDSESDEAKSNHWDDTSLSLSERTRLLRLEDAHSVLLFRVNGGYIAEGDDAKLINSINKRIVPYTDPATGMTIAYVSNSMLDDILPHFIISDRRLVFTDMYV